MTNQFQGLRLTIRAVLVSSLLVLGHFLLISAPNLAADEDTQSALRASSAILFHTLLWTIFVLFEEADSGSMGQAKVNEGSGALFISTAAEWILNSIIFGAWIAYAGPTSALIKSVVIGNTAGLWMIPVSYMLAIAAVTTLQVHLVFSILLYAIRSGPGELLRWSFWRERAGHWEPSIRLAEDEVDDLVSCEKGLLGSVQDLKK
ncbi:hypothetical protein BD324DRAFT_652959 [Kockovaella imperatae]|uniref:Uncharacterized protein n=1 Tax=Kockovaella imperatae TaxID=4999 RepID=A0A1Y1UAZ9_9TREE|nr:hypothetical protein BD324DRAFT_652959 [Kockovaella imperatae]ORX34697.1 hypothetical protein BD324DRAFT_652959 [Kockovaella imperatae]